MPCFHFRNHTQNNRLIRKHVTYLVKIHLNVRSIYNNISFLIEKSFLNLSSLLQSLTYLSLLNSFLLLVLRSQSTLSSKIKNMTVLLYTYFYNISLNVLRPTFFNIYSLPFLPSPNIGKIRVKVGPKANYFLLIYELLQQWLIENRLKFVWIDLLVYYDFSKNADWEVHLRFIFIYLFIVLSLQRDFFLYSQRCIYWGS